NSPIAFTIKVLPFAKVWVPMKFNLLFASQVRVPVPEAFNWAPLCTVALPEQSRLPDKVSVLAMLRTPADWTVKSLWAFAVMSPDEFSVPRRLKLEVAFNDSCLPSANVCVPLKLTVLLASHVKLPVAPT